MRYEAAWACGEMGLRRATSLLSRLIDDPDRQVCNATIWALGQIGGEQAKQILLTALDEADEDMRAAIDEALAELALITGDLEFVLYDLERGQEKILLEDDFIPLWPAGEDDAAPLDEDE
jgi:HEAT repeat protein